MFAFLILLTNFTTVVKNSSPSSENQVKATVLGIKTSILVNPLT